MLRAGNTGSGKNCELSDRDARDIQTSTLDRDQDWDVFERTRYSGECRDNSQFGTGSVIGQNSIVSVGRIGQTIVISQCH